MFYLNDCRRRIDSGRCGVHTRSAFSLVEIMVVIVIIGLLAGVLAVAIRPNLAKARVNTAKLEMGKLYDQIELFKSERGNYPESLDLLLEKSVETGYAAAKESDLTDPWGNPYQYLVPGPEGEPFELISLGADGREGGQGENQDISHLDLDR